MSKNPWFQFYHSDWISGTRRLSPTTRAIYIDILCMIYSEGGAIVRDDIGMAKECAVTLGTFKKAIEELLWYDKLTEINGQIFNEKAAKSIEKAERKSKGSSDAANKRWSEFNQQKQQPADANALPTHDERICESDASTTTTTSTSIKKELLHSKESEVVGLAGLELKLRKAAKWEQEPHPNLFITGQIDALIKAGASLDQDVLPVVSATAPKCQNRTTWNYFVPAIRRAWETRVAAGKPLSGKSEIDAQAKKAAAQKFLDDHNAKHEAQKNGIN